MLLRKLSLLPWDLLFVLLCIVILGLLALYSAAGGSLSPWALRQSARFIFGLIVMLALSVIDIRLFFKQAYMIYGVCLLLVWSVELLGFAGMGAQRWIDLYVCSIQPSEFMKLALVLALARYLHTHGTHFTEGHVYLLIIPTILVLLAVLPILRQPDLGTAIILVAVAALLALGAGIHLWYFGAVGAGLMVLAPILWSFLRDYQKKRILIFLDPGRDPLGAGYHVLQSQIALGSGGVWGKGFLAGTQSYLNFLPEKQTDFIFTMFCEEFGFFGGAVLLVLYLLTLLLCYRAIFRTRHVFTRLLGLGIASIFFLHIFVNTGMVMGLLPVVGVPLPLVSYGGTSLLTLLMGFGILFSIEIHYDVRLSRASLQSGLFLR